MHCMLSQATGTEMFTGLSMSLCPLLSVCEHHLLLGAGNCDGGMTADLCLMLAVMPSMPLMPTTTSPNLAWMGDFSPNLDQSDLPDL